MVTMSSGVDVEAKLEGSAGAACFRSCCAGAISCGMPSWVSLRHSLCIHVNSCSAVVRWPCCTRTSDSELCALSR